MPLTIYHNPRCSKSRQTLALIEATGQSPEVVLYLETSPDAKTLKNLAGQMGAQATDLIRFKEELAKELGISPADQRSEEEWFALLAANPKLLERPIVSNGKQAVMGRPPENVNSLL